MSTSEPLERESEGEELVAYLDGELPPDDSRRIEERLSNDEDYLLQLRQLDQAWEALDALPRPAADDDFARTTIEMVAQKAQLDLTQRVEEVAQVERQKHFRWIAAAVLVAATSFAIASFALPNPDQELLENLPVIRQSHLLTEISDVAFLEALTKEVSIDQLVRYKEAFEREVKAIEGASAPTPAARKEWVKSQTEEQQQSLYAQQKRYFGDYTDKGRMDLTTKYEQIASHPDRDKLQHYLVAYGQWLVGKGENLKVELRDGALPVSDRMNRIKSVVDREVMDGARRLSDEERSRMRREISEISAEHRDEVHAFFSQEESPIPGFDERVWDDQRAKLLKFLDAGEAPAELLVVTWTLMNPETMESTRARLVEQLDTPSREFLDRDGERRGGPRGGDRRANILGRWISDTMIATRGIIGSDELMTFFRSLSPAQKQRLLESPSSEFEAEVRNLLVEQENGLRELSQLMGIDTGRGGGQRGGRGGQNQGGRGGRGGPFGTDFDGPGGPEGPPPMPGGGFGSGFGPPPDGKRGD